MPDIQDTAACEAEIVALLKWRTQGERIASLEATLRQFVKDAEWVLKADKRNSFAGHIKVASEAALRNSETK